MKKTQFLSLLCILIVTSIGFAQNSTNSFKSISGYLSSNDGPLSSVNIKIENHINGTESNSRGFYEISAKIGDLIHFSHVGYHKVSVIVEDVTEVLNIKMQLQANELGTAVVKARKKVKSMGEIAHEKRTATIMTGVGKINLRAIAQKVDYIDGKTLNPAAPSFQDAIKGKFTGPRPIPSIWDIDGFIHVLSPGTPAPPIDISTVEDIYVLSGSSGTVRWGGPVLVIRTSMSSFGVSAEKEKVAESYRNQNFYQDDALPINASEQDNDNPSLKTISGTITYMEVPVANVHVISETNGNSVKTDASGKFSIEAAVGEELRFSHVSFSSVFIIVEDITQVLNLKMVPKKNELDEVYLENRVVKGKVQEQDEKAKKKFITARGTIDPKKSGFAVTYLDGEYINAIGYTSLTQALVGKFAGYSVGLDGLPYLRGANMSITQNYPAIWDVDGQIFTIEPPISPTEIKEIYVLKAVGAVVKYGNIANGGVIILKTKYGDFGEQRKKRDLSAAKLQNKDFYENDAVTLDAPDIITQEFSKTLAAFGNQDEAIGHYQNIWADTMKDPHLKITLAKKALQLYGNKKLAVIIFSDIATKHRENSEILKAVAYQYQAAGLKKEAIAMYEKVYTLRPGYAQSYRDLSNAYIENEQFKRGWRLYLSYLFQGNNLNDEGIGEVLYNEMEWIYFNRKNQTEIRELFMPKSDDVFEFRNDIRVVVEWNTSEAEFDLEFVSPEKRSYVFEHTSVAAQEIITKEKKVGYSSKQFFVDDLEEGDWLFNATYYGNKKPEPTYLKVTSYYNWGLPNQTQKVNVFTLNRTETKFKLITYNKEDLKHNNTVVANN